MIAATLPKPGKFRVSSKPSSVYCTPSTSHPGHLIDTLSVGHRVNITGVFLFKITCDGRPAFLGEGGQAVFGTITSGGWVMLRAPNGDTFLHREDELSTPLASFRHFWRTLETCSNTFGELSTPLATTSVHERTNFDSLTLDVVPRNDMMPLVEPARCDFGFGFARCEQCRLQLQDLRFEVVSDKGVSKTLQTVGRLVALRLRPVVNRGCATCGQRMCWNCYQAHDCTLRILPRRGRFFY